MIGATLSHCRTAAPAERTIAGVREGRDEFFGKALEVIKGGGAASLGVRLPDNLP